MITRHPKVAEVCVVPVTDKAGGGEVPRALIVIKTGETCTEDDILDFAHGEVQHHSFHGAS